MDKYSYAVDFGRNLYTQTCYCMADSVDEVRQRAIDGFGLADRKPDSYTIMIYNHTTKTNY